MDNKKFKHLMSLLLFLSLLLLFCACGTGEKDPATTNDPTDIEVENEEVKHDQTLEVEKSNEKTLEDTTKTKKDLKEDKTSSDANSKNEESKKTESKDTSNDKSKDKTSTSDTKKPSSDSSTNKPSTEKPKEKTVTVKYPLYGDMYTIYWIKYDAEKIIYETKDAKEWEHVLSTPDNDVYYKASTYGSEGKQDIVGYDTVTMTESEWKTSLWRDDPNCKVTYNKLILSLDKMY